MNHLGQTTYNSITDIDNDIYKYRTNIAGLKKIMLVGSPTGRQKAAGKLAEAEKNLKVLLQKRTRLAKEGSLAGFGSLGCCGSCEGGCNCGKPVSMFPCMHCGRHRPTSGGCPHCGQNKGYAKCGGKTVIQKSCGNGMNGFGDFDGAVGSAIGNLGIVAIVLASLTAWIIQAEKGGAARDDGLQWYDIAALPAHAVMIPLSYVAAKIGP